MVSTAAAALGFLAFGDSSSHTLSAAATALLDVAGIKSESVMFAVGEALCLVFGGENSIRLVE